MSVITLSGIEITAIAGSVPRNSLHRANSEPAKIKGTVVETPLTARVSLPEQTSSDLGFQAATSIINEKRIDPAQIGALIFVSTTPDYRSPATACVLQHRLGIPKDCIAYDINTGGTAFTHGLQVAGAILNGINREFALVIMADTPSKQILNGKPSARYRDSGSAVLLQKSTDAVPIVIESLTFSHLFDTISLPSGGFRASAQTNTNLITDETSLMSFVQEHSESILNRFLSSQNPPSIYDHVLVAEEIIQFLSRVKANDVALGLKWRELASASRAPNSVGVMGLLSLVTSPHRPGERLRVLSAEIGEGVCFGLTDFYIGSEALLPLVETDSFFTEGSVSHQF